ncbi:MAG: Molybdate-binding protein ModA [Chroococcopsis gigantea SAG 12.99]|jgi:molybdate transport system substrate-binding protein|nr:molybdate ABC transporter substrate-binding protein [Chlorogloea purpurea SAG 13.99]MDV2999444.1 Molybdate-binding protein ModA [Chroococcopsis gigantea SAG 12.99]
MKKKTKIDKLILLVTTVVLTIGINSVINFLTIPSVSSAPKDLLVSAAASLRDALEEIKPVYQKENTAIALTYNFGSSGSLQQQIEQGAPVDVFISAAKKQMDALQTKNLLVDNTRKNLLKNRMVLVVPKNNTTIRSFQDLGGGEVKKIAIGEPGSVPAGQYAGEILKAIGLTDKVKDKLVYAKDVRQVLSYVATGNVDAGFVYITDAKTSNNVRVVATAPENTHSPIIYPIAVIKNSKSADSGKKFLQFLSRGKAKAVFEKYGFIPL